MGVRAQRAAQTGERILDAATHARRMAQVVAVCDAYTWKRLRRDAGLTPADTETALLELLEPLLEAS